MSFFARTSLTAGVVAALAVPSHHLRAEQEVQCREAGPGRERCRISQPVVTRPVTEYQQIRLRFGDRVVIRAGGCVQTGGSGRTWKRYLDPLGPNSDGLYFGLIRLPSFNVDWESEHPLNGFQRIQDIIDRVIEVRDPPCPPRADCLSVNNGDDVGYLQLGYADDDYGDNGYWGHDDGTGDQCRGVGPAWLELTISRYPTTRGLEFGIDRPGSDYRSFDLREPGPELCREACNRESSCVAFTYVKPGVQGKRARCWLKSSVPVAVRDDCCVSGVK